MSQNFIAKKRLLTFDSPVALATYLPFQHRFAAMQPFHGPPGTGELSHGAQGSRRRRDRGILLTLSLPADSRGRPLLKQSLVPDQLSSVGGGAGFLFCLLPAIFRSIREGYQV